MPAELPRLCLRSLAEGPIHPDYTSAVLAVPGRHASLARLPGWVGRLHATAGWHRRVAATEPCESNGLASWSSENISECEYDHRDDGEHDVPEQRVRDPTASSSRLSRR